MHAFLGCFTDAHALEGGAGFLHDDQLPSVTTTVEVKEIESTTVLSD